MALAISPPSISLAPGQIAWFWNYAELVRGLAGRARLAGAVLTASSCGRPAKLGGSNQCPAQGLLPGLNLLAGTTGIVVPHPPPRPAHAGRGERLGRKAELPSAAPRKPARRAADIGQTARLDAVGAQLLGACCPGPGRTWLWLYWSTSSCSGLHVLAAHYVPRFGSIIAGVLAVLVAFLQLGPLWALIAAGGIIAIDQAIGNVLDPRLQGRALDISPLVVLLSVIFWGWIWGVPGMILAVPMTATLITLCELVPALRPAAILMSGSGDPKGD